jgi:hypothetical protein
MGERTSILREDLPTSLSLVVIMEAYRVFCEIRFEAEYTVDELNITVKHETLNLLSTADCC